MAAPIIDWHAAEWAASRMAGTGSDRSPDIDLAAVARDAETRVAAYTGLVPAGPLPPPEMIDRRAWIQANIRSMRALLDPVLERAGTGLGPMQPMSRFWLEALSTAEISFVLGFLSQRVLGQYELVLLDEAAGMDPPRLLFVMPNLVSAVEKLDVDEHEFLTWVTLHEVTHAVQFGGVPWLQPYLASMVRELLARAEARMEKERRLRLPPREELFRIAGALRHGDLVTAFAGTEERELIDRVQAVMAVIEGHAEHVMDAVGVEVLESLPALREALDTRRTTQSRSVRAIMRLLGFEMKLSQYKRGKIFCDAIVAGGGREALERVFSNADALPSLAEIEDPAAWLARTTGKF